MQYEKIEVGYHRGRYNPFTTAFCRTRDHGNVLLVGGYEECRKRLEGLGPALVSWRYWRNGRTRGGLHMENVKNCYVSSKKVGNRTKYQLTYRGEQIELWRRIPSSFPHGLGNLILNRWG